MSVVKAQSLPLVFQIPFSPYEMSHHHPRTTKTPVKIPADGRYMGIDPTAWNAFNETQSSLSQWVNEFPIYPGGRHSDASQCPPDFSNSKFEDVNLYSMGNEDVNPGLFNWQYEGNAGFDSSYPSLPESSVFSNSFPQSVSVVSCSPRSDASGPSLSPQPNIYEYSTAFNFGFSPIPAHFPTSPTPSSWSQSQLLSVNQSRRSSISSHSPSTSISSLDVVESPSVPPKGTTPSKPETDAQQARRRFPCVIIGCERRFTSQYTLKVHLEAHKPKPRSSFPCTLGCSERFSRQHDRLRHEVAKHGKICEFLCEDCGRFFSTKKTLGNHKCPVAQGGTRWVNQ